MRDVQSEEPMRAAYYRETLQHWVASLADAPRPGGATPEGTMTREQCEQLKALGYTHTGCP
jgi:hypothetical protein